MMCPMVSKLNGVADAEGSGPYALQRDENLGESANTPTKMRAIDLAFEGKHAEPRGRCSESMS